MDFVLQYKELSIKTVVESILHDKFRVNLAQEEEDTSTYNQLMDVLNRGEKVENQY